MESITRKPEIRSCNQSVLTTYEVDGSQAAADLLHQLVPCKKVIHRPSLIQEKRARMKILPIISSEDFPKKDLITILQLAIQRYN